MSENVYACLAGNWVNLSKEDDCVMGPHQKHPSIWYEEGAEIYSPAKKDKFDCYYELDYVQIAYKGKDYHINPIFIQIVTED